MARSALTDLLYVQRHRHNPALSTETELNLVGFRVGAGLFAVDVSSVKEILAQIALVNVPQASRIVLGVIEHRGRVVPIVDLRRRFALPPLSDGRRAKWIVVDIGSEWFGLCVDEVTEVFGVTSAQERPVPRVGATDVAQGFTKVYTHERQLVMVLDLAHLARAVDRDEVAPAPLQHELEETGSR
jgi:purine-binding chemotaxis protein CheW